MGWPVAASHSRAVLSPLPVSDGLAVGTERHGHRPLLLLHGRAVGLPVAASQSRAVLSEHPVSDGLAVGAERHGLDHALMLHGLADGFSGSGVPEPRRARPGSPVRTVLPSGLNATALTSP